uniref:Cytochrome P450 4C1 n=2 Tax=Cacopsylla melanoneura TaxID=428564 RepID=A0A8D8WTB5_9HEMI
METGSAGYSQQSFTKAFPFNLSSLNIKLSLIVVTILAIYHWRRRKLYALSWKLEGPPALPIIGNAYVFLASMDVIFKSMNKMHNKYRRKGHKMYRFWVGPDFIANLIDVKYICTILNQSLKKGKTYSLIEDQFHNGIFVNPNIPHWRASRKTIVPVFHFEILKSYIRIFHKEATILARKWEKYADSGATFNPENDINLATFDMVMMSTLGLNPRAQDNPGNQSFMHNFDKLFEITQTRMFNPLLYSNFICKLTGLWAEQKKHAADLIKESQKILDQIRERQRKQKANELNATELDEIRNHAKSFAELMMESPGYKKEDDSELISQIVTVIGAGQDTTKSQNIVTLLMLALHPDIQDKVQEEIDRVLGPDPDYCPTYEDLCSLEYIDMVIKESLRMFPAAPIITRDVSEDSDYGNGLTLPGGTTVFVSIYALHRDPRFYPNPDKFDPSRWSPDLVAQRPANCFMPFSTGPRNCIGGKYAMMAMKTVLAKLLKTYRVLPSEECSRVEDIGFELRVTIKMNENSKIRLKRRN